MAFDNLEAQPPIHPPEAEEYSRRALELSWTELHLLALDADDVHEDAAGDRIARKVAGTGVAVRPASGGHWPLVAVHRGVLTIDTARLDQINGQISASEAYISTLSTRIDRLTQRSMAYAPYNTKPGARRMPDDLAEEMVRALSDLRTQNTALAQRRAELQKFVDQFDADIKRFKELRTSAAARLNDASLRKK